MHKKPGFFQKAQQLLAGKGFYMVLLLCLVILGASGFALYRTVSGIGAAASQDVSAPAEITVTAPTDSQSEEEAQSDLTGEEDAAPDLEQVKETAPESASESEAETEAALEPVQQDAAPVAAPEEEAAVPVAAPTEEAPAESQPEAEEVAAPAEEVQAEAAPAALLWPVEGDVVAAFSGTELTYNEALGDWRTHNGMDIAADLGAEVLAAADGTVESIATDPVTGTTLTLSHSGGMTTVYGNLDPDTLSVAAGDTVTAGQVLACVGSSAAGETAGAAFLHFAVTVDGQGVDPQLYLS